MVCGLKREKSALLRIVRRPDGGVVVDPTGRVSGRGAYVCESRRCWELAFDRGRLTRALAIALDSEAQERLIGDLLTASAAGAPGRSSAAGGRQGGEG